jgi:hypothetical protein
MSLMKQITSNLRVKWNIHLDALEFLDLPLFLTKIYMSNLGFPKNIYKEVNIKCTSLLRRHSTWLLVDSVTFLGGWTLVGQTLVELPFTGKLDIGRIHI